MKQASAKIQSLENTLSKQINDISSDLINIENLRAEIYQEKVLMETQLQNFQSATENSQKKKSA